MSAKPMMLEPEFRPVPSVKEGNVGGNDLAKKVVVSILTNQLTSGDVLVPVEDIPCRYENSDNNYKEFDTLYSQFMICEKPGIGLVVTELDLSHVHVAHSVLIPLYPEIMQNIIENITDEKKKGFRKCIQNIWRDVDGFEGAFNSILEYVDAVCLAIDDKLLRTIFENNMPVIMRFMWQVLNEDQDAVVDACVKLSAMHEMLVSDDLDYAIAGLTKLGEYQEKVLSRHCK